MAVANRVKLAEGRNFTIVEVRTCSAFAEVLGGTVHQPHDFVMLPDMELAWEEAAERDGNGDTLVSPFDLEIVFDALTGAQIIPENLEAYHDRVERYVETHPDDPASWTLGRLLEAGDVEDPYHDPAWDPRDIKALLNLLVRREREADAQDRRGVA